MAIQHWYLHADLDAFFASVEQMDHPEYRGKPVIVGGLPTDPRSVVSTASYEARKYGVHSAMPTREAYRLCPNGIYTHGNHKRYSELSYQIMEIFRRFSPDVQQMSIDEAFIDLTGTERLFGPPEETAMKIKEAVKNEIGLTVSIGLAQTKYFAKLSSEINKPDGFYFMKPGTETAYMTSIPIEKIWGIGKKTAGRIKDSGIKTTLQLYNTPLESLIFMYGDNTANFLYNILRGKADNMFGTESKTHSVSNEKTFPVDITDYYANETVLLELAHSVMFRLLRDNLRSRTVVIKIRYDDFTTVSARQTFETDIITLDSLFEKVRFLFDKKYERGRGVRLLGVGFDNVTSEPAVYQQSLFDDGQKKKQAVEKAILKFETKYPDLPVKKARLIDSKSKAVFAFIISLFASGAIGLNERLYAKGLQSSGAGSIRDYEVLPLPEEAPEHLFDLKMNNSNVEFFSSGYWKAETATSFYQTFGNGINSGLGFGGFVFKQEVDLDFNLLINKKWFFNTAFADEFKRNTITFGYQNEENPDFFIKKAVLSNRNIIYPEHYSSSVFNFNPQGGNNQSPGFYMNMKGTNWESNLMFRYDLAKTNSAVFYGMNEVTDLKIPLSDFVRNRFYYIPKEYISSVQDIFVQVSQTYKDTKYSDSKERLYRKLEKGKDYLLYTDGETSFIVLNKSISSVLQDVSPFILVTFQNESIFQSLKTSIGSYSQTNSFLGKVQNFFSKNNSIKGKLQPSNFSYELYESIENTSALVIQSDISFSPFMWSSIYDLGNAASSSQADIMVRSSSSEKTSEEYSVLTNQFLSFGSQLTDNHLYGSVFNNTITAESDEEKIIQKMFPFGNVKSEVYFFTSPNEKCDLEIIERNYHSVTELSINPSLKPQMVRVYINQIQDTGARYNTQTGHITLSKQVSDTDKIIVSWQEESSDYLDGAFTAASGYKINLLENLCLDADITAFWPLSPFTSFSTENDSKPGHLSINQGIYFEKNNFKIQNNFSTAITNPDVTGKKLVYETNGGSAQTSYHKNDGAKKSLKTPKITDLENAELLPQTVITPSKDQSISGWKLPLEINFAPSDAEKNIYTSINIELPDFILGDTLNIALKPQWKNQIPENVSNMKVYLQLGLCADESIQTEEKDFPFWELTSGINVKEFLDLTNTDWQIISVNLTDEMKPKLTGYHDARLIFYEENHKLLTEGFIYAGPYETEGSSVNIFNSETLTVSSATRLNGSKNYVTKISFEPSSFPGENYSVSLSDYFTSSNFSDYNRLNFTFKKENLRLKTALCNAFVITLGSGCTIELDSSLIENLSDSSWHTISLDINDYIKNFAKCIYIDGTKADSTLYSVQFDRNNVPYDFSVTLNGYEKGTFWFDNIYYSGSDLHFKIQDNLETSYVKNGSILKAGNTNIISDFSFTGKSLYTGDFLQTFSDYNQSMETYGNYSINILGVKASADIKASVLPETKTKIETAGHKLSFDNSQFPVLNLIKFQDSFRYTPEKKISEKTDSLTFDLSHLGFPLSINATDTQKTSELNHNGTETFSISYNGKYIKPGVFSSFTDTTNLKNSTAFSNEYFDQYASLWKNISNFGNTNAYSRTELLGTKLQGNIPLFSLTPAISMSVNSTYAYDTIAKITDLEKMEFELPFRIQKNNFRFLWTKKASGVNQITKGGNYYSDMEQLFQIQNQRLWFYNLSPFYDLLDKKLLKNVESDISSNEKILSSEYSFRWNRSLFNTGKDFFIPNSVSLSTGRIIKSSVSANDIINYQVELNGQALNMFGTDGVFKLFKWYKDDEFLSSGKVHFSHPFENPKEITSEFSVYEQILLYMSNTNSLKGSVDFTGTFAPHEDFLYNARASLLYTMAGSKSPLKSIILFFYNNSESKEEIKTSIIRKESFNMELGTTTDGYFHKMEAGHRCDVKFQKYYSIYGSADLSYSYKLQNHNLALDLTLGAQMTF